MELRWKILLQRQGIDQPVSIGSFERPVNGATPADFGWFFAEGRWCVQLLLQAT